MMPGLYHSLFKHPGFLLLLCMFYTSCTTLECPSCEKIHCNPRKASKLQCLGGVTTGICNCCPVCAKVEREKCGGDWDYLGKCDRGLVCQTENITPLRVFQETYGEPHKPTGICVKAQKHVGDEAVSVKCLPKCTPRFCRRRPKAICSAKNVVEKSGECHGYCQHTSCRACRFLPEEPRCDTCSKDDFQCLRKFGKCMRRAVCKRNIFPCRKSKILKHGKFVCAVPGCMSLS